MHSQSTRLLSWTQTHSLKFHSITFPDGIVVFSDSPYVGRRHDSGLLNDSGLAELLANRLRGVDGRQLCIYGMQLMPNDHISSLPSKALNSSPSNRYSMPRWQE